MNAFSFVRNTLCAARSNPGKAADGKMTSPHFSCEHLPRCREMVWLGVILCLAFVVRMLGPLREPALGQTDAYGHLQFLQDILQSGRLRHPLYPPAYYWLLSVPVRIFRLDPYVTVRFAGAFFGLGLVAGVHVLARAAFGRRAALWSALLVAAFPAFHWLQKTGVGAYPSQLGLFLLPLLLVCWDGAMRRGGWALGGFAALSVLLATSVPMMLLDMLPFLAFDFGRRAIGRGINRSAWVAAISSAAAMAGMLIWIGSQGGVDEILKTAAHVSGVPASEQAAPIAALWQIALTYMMPERWGPQGRWFQAAAWIVGIVLLTISLRYRRAAVTANPVAGVCDRGMGTMIAWWALFTWSQTVFGVFQFSLYMRAGWLLLIALALWGGWLTVWIGDRLAAGLPRWTWYTVIAAASLLTLGRPPAPVPHLSPAESDLVTAARQLDAWSDGRRPAPAFEWLLEIPDSRPVVVWSRPYTDFPGGQGDPLHALLEGSRRIEVRTVETGMTGETRFEHGADHIIFLDDRASWRHDPGLMRVVAPHLEQDFERMRTRLMKGSHALRNRTDAVSPETWCRTVYPLPQGLEIVHLFPCMR